MAEPLLRKHINLILMNNLKSEKSSYLKSAVNQPVNWFPWCRDAFQAAREKDLPVLLDIGAVWCHWCHVMDAESYDDLETAAFINENFIPVKVDKDERPDIDLRYQKAVSMYAGRGGWPLTAFLTYEGYFFYGGTYFPKEPMYGLPPYKSVLSEISNYYRDNKEAVFSQSRDFYERLFKRPEKFFSAGLNIFPGKGLFKGDNSLDEDYIKNLCSTATNEFKANFDPVNGGLDESPKFFYFSSLDLLLGDYVINGDAHSLEQGMYTLKKMLYGGVFDHVGGGFHRYSTDKKWIIPHFEKLSSDNASALRVYSYYYRITGDPVILNAINRILDFISGELYDRLGGGFYASIDADIGKGTEGDYFTWTSAEFKEVFSKTEELLVAEKMFNLGKEGVMENGRNVLYLGYEEGLDGVFFSKIYRYITKKLRTERGKKKKPFIDKIKYSSVNGSVIYSLTEVVKILDPFNDESSRRKILEMAEKSIEPFIAVLDKNGAIPRFIGEHGGSVLEDNTYIALGLTGLFEATAYADYLIYAKKIAEYIIKNFYDGEQGGFYDIMQGAGSSSIGYLEYREKTILDYGGYSANSLTLRLMARLFLLTAEVQFKNVINKTLEFFASDAENYKYNVSGAIKAMVDFISAPEKNIVVGKLQDEGVKRYMQGFFGFNGKKIKPVTDSALIFVDVNKKRILSDYLKEGSIRSGFEMLIFDEIRSAINEYLQKKQALAYTCGNGSCNIEFLR